MSVNFYKISILWFDLISTWDKFTSVVQWSFLAKKLKEASLLSCFGINWKCHAEFINFVLKTSWTHVLSLKECIIMDPVFPITFVKVYSICSYIALPFLTQNPAPVFG